MTFTPIKRKPTAPHGYAARSEVKGKRKTGGLKPGQAAAQVAALKALHGGSKPA